MAQASACALVPCHTYTESKFSTLSSNSHTRFSCLSSGLNIRRYRKCHDAMPSAVHWMYGCSSSFSILSIGRFWLYAYKKTSNSERFSRLFVKQKPLMHIATSKSSWSIQNCSKSIIAFNLLPSNSVLSGKTSP